MTGAGFDPALASSPPVFFALVRDFGSPVTCEFIGGASVRHLTIDAGGRLAGSFVLTSRGHCNQAPGKHHATVPGRYSVNVGCVACSVGVFTVTPGDVVQGAPCRDGQLVLRLGPRISEATQQSSRVFTVRNDAGRPCHIEGYPRVALLDVRGARISFRYHDGGDQMITSRPPETVVLAPGETAYFMINKTSCVRGAPRGAVAARVILPGTQRSREVRIGTEPLLSYCGAGHAGHTVSVSPIEATFRGMYG